MCCGWSPSCRRGSCATARTA
ncbi:MAG: hypothetical protein E4H24_04335 [Thermomicrobiales bacterium]|nr:MAG: hypothetical protein E4H24_04335 [Thermomicrobiales bacterium]